jgi:DNA-directed RNA polymerase subunit beta
MVDFVDEDTGEVVSSNVTKSSFDRDTVIDKDNVEEIIDATQAPILLHTKSDNTADYSNT